VGLLDAGVVRGLDSVRVAEEGEEPPQVSTTFFGYCQGRVRIELASTHRWWYCTQKVLEYHGTRVLEYHGTRVHAS
jgi:hypothetical protein